MPEQTTHQIVTRHMESINRPAPSAEEAVDRLLWFAKVLRGEIKIEPEYYSIVDYMEGMDL